MSTTITAADVKALRERTGAGMMDCKKALAEADGDMDKAIEILRVKGQAQAAKRGERAFSPIFGTIGIITPVLNLADSATGRWGAPRIHGELLKLRFEFAQSSVARSNDWGRPARDGAPSCVTMRRTLPRWTCSWLRPLASICSMPSSSFG